MNGPEAQISSHHPFRSLACQAEFHSLYEARARAWPVASETRLLDTPSGKTFVFWLLNDTVRSGAEGQARVDQFVADWALAERCFRHLLLIPATVLSDDTLRAWPTPTLYLVGENEKIYPARRAIARLNRLAPHIQTRLIPGAGHDLWMVQAETVNAAMLSFLDED